MALTATEKAICNKLVYDFYNILGPVYSAKYGILGKINQAINNLDSMIFSPAAAVNAAISDLYSQTAGLIPGSDLADINRMIKFLEECLYLNTLNPVSLIFGTSNGIYQEVDKILDSIATTVPEFGVGKLFGQVFKLLNGLGIPGGQALSDLLKSADRLINCLALYCTGYGGYATLYQTQLDTIFSELYLDNDPLSPNYAGLDTDLIYDAAGLSVAQKTQMTQVINSVSTVNTNIQTGLNNAINSVKQYAKQGVISI